jgi:hypothetical protein
VTSTPPGCVAPDLTTVPAPFFSSHTNASVASVTSVAPFGPLGRYPTWLTRTRGPVSGTYGSGADPPSSETLSTQNVQGSGEPPSWNATCPCGVVAGCSKVLLDDVVVVESSSFDVK